MGGFEMLNEIGEPKNILLMYRLFRKCSLNLGSNSFPRLIMKETRASSTFIFLFTVVLLIIRPVIIFGSVAVQQAYLKESKVFGLVRSVRKRKEKIPSVVLYREEERQIVGTSFLAFLLLFLRKWQRKALELLSLFVSGLHFLLKRRRTFFEIIPDNQHYLMLSVFRI